MPPDQIKMRRKEEFGEHLQGIEGSGQVREGLHSDNQGFEKIAEERKEKETKEKKTNKKDAKCKRL